ncbi:MAG TPA: TraR/DksA family transcriptional regulator [Nitrospirae bacterium]|nr:TraR/DksA family transcriptional regulator [Nitrospirota bacterium]
MDKDSAARFRKTLISLKGQLAGDHERIVGASSEEFGADMPDINDEASRTMSRRILLEIGDKNFDAINQVNDALDRIEKGEYGICEECEDSIPVKRLELLPFAKYCVECQERLEK